MEREREKLRESGKHRRNAVSHGPQRSRDVWISAQYRIRQIWKSPTVQNMETRISIASVRPHMQNA